MFVIRREIHLIENLKINMFLDKNILKSENIAINIVKKSIFINNIKIIIALKILKVLFNVRFIYVKRLLYRFMSK